MPLLFALILAVLAAPARALVALDALSSASRTVNAQQDSQPQLHGRSRVRSLSTHTFQQCSIHTFAPDGQPQAVPFIAPRNDHIVSASVCKEGVWSQPILSRCLELIQPGSNVLDVGANVGAYTIPFAARVSVSAHLLGVGWVASH